MEQLLLHQLPRPPYLKPAHTYSILRPNGCTGEDDSSGLLGWSCDPDLANHHILLPDNCD